MALIKEYFELTDKYKDEYGESAILLMQVGSFFEVYGIQESTTGIITKSKIVDFSQICELNIVKKNTCVGQDNVVMAGFKDMQIEKYIKKIQDAGFTAVVYTQDESAKNTSRSLSGVFSPGTYFHNENQKLTNSIVCIWIELVENKLFNKGKFIVIGVSNIDIYTGKTNIFQFKEKYSNNPTTYDELERFISIYNPCETIIISNLEGENEIDDVINYTSIKSSLIHKIKITNEETPKMTRVKNCEKQVYQMELLSKFYKIENYDAFVQNFYDNNIATQSFCYLLDFVYQHNTHLVNNIAEPVFDNCSNRLLLANHSLKQLNIINDGTTNSSKHSSVSQLLNECITPMGKRKFAYNILNPIYDEVKLQREYDITDYFLSKYSFYEPFIKQQLSTIRDISKWERQIFLKKISPRDIFNLNDNLCTIWEVYEKMGQDNTIKEYFLETDPFVVNIKSCCNEITTFIDENIDLEIAYELEQTRNFEINFINNGIDQELDLQTTNLKEMEAKLLSITKCLNSLIENREKKSAKINDCVKIHETEKNSLSLITTIRRSKLLTEGLPDQPKMVELNYCNTDTSTTKSFNFEISKKKFTFEKQSASNHFILHDDITALCRSISSIKISMKELITTVYNKFVTKFELYQAKMESIINFITMVDMVYTKSSIALKYNYCKPTIKSSDKSFVNAKNLRHCLIERFQSNELYVSNDVVLGDGNVDGILLYGTNAVGKTTLIRSLGISVIMAQAGLFVPCSEFTYMPYKYIFTRIIGNDNMFKGLSTFAVEMSELRTILRLGDQNSLILGDELCSGTEIQSAISIFVAGIQKMHDLKSSFIFATHLHEITNYEEIISLKSVKLKHLSVVYNKEQDLLIYDRKLKDGPGTSMYGLEVCKSLGLPQEFLDAAYEIRMKYHPTDACVLSLKTSRYNSKKIVGMCEKCGTNIGTEVHHLQHQSAAEPNDYIVSGDNTFHKNNLANLMTLCETCHHTEHSNTKNGSKRIKTTNGTKIALL